MTIEIINIQNSKLRDIAQKADSQGENSYNEVLDENEISFFMAEAKKEGCDMNEVMEVIRKSGIDLEKSGANDKIKLQQEIDALANKIEKKEDELKALRKQASDMQPGFWEQLNTGGKIGACVSGLAFGLGTGMAILSSIVAKRPYSGKGLAKTLGVLGGSVAGLLGALPGALVGTIIGGCESSYSAKVKEKKVEEFESKANFKQKEVEIAAMREELNKKMQQL